jgi:hypothetical protein
MGRLADDSKCPDIDERIFNQKADDWKEFYGDVEEELPPNMPKPRGHLVTISAFVDANPAGNVITRHLHSGMLIFVKNAPIISPLFTSTGLACCFKLPLLLTSLLPTAPSLHMKVGTAHAVIPGHIIIPGPTKVILPLLTGFSGDGLCRSHFAAVANVGSSLPWAHGPIMKRITGNAFSLLWKIALTQDQMESGT